MRAKSKKIDKAGILDELDEALTNSSKVAATFGDELLVYLIDMAVLHVRKKAIHLNDGTGHRLQDVPFKPVPNFEFARSHLSSLASGIRSISTLKSSAAQ